MSYCSNYFAVKGKKLFDPKQKGNKMGNLECQTNYFESKIGPKAP